MVYEIKRKLLLLKDWKKKENTEDELLMCFNLHVWTDKDAKKRKYYSGVDVGDSVKAMEWKEYILITM